MARHETANSTREWTIDGFRAFWAKPDISMVPAIRSTITRGIIGHWPRPIGDILDPDLYLGVIADMLIVCPDWSLAVPEFAESGDLHFIRWIATGTDPDGRFEFNGCDRVKTNASGQVCENYIFCDHPFFEQNLRFSWCKQTQKPGAELIDHGVFIDLSSPATHRLPHSLSGARRGLFFGD